MARITSHEILHDRTTSVLLRVATPLMLNSLIHTIYTLADGLYVARLSSTHFAATSFVWPVMFLFVSLGIGISVAGTSIISQLIGAERLETAKKYAMHLIVIGAVLGVLMSIIGGVSAPHIVAWMGAKGDLRELASLYLQINLIGYIIDMLYFAFQAILNAQGDTKSTTIISACSAVANIVLDPIFIFDRVPLIGIPGLNMGIAGAAIATVLSKGLSVYLGIMLLKKNRGEVKVGFRGFRWEMPIAKEIMRVGMPTAINQSGTAMGFTILNTFIAEYGTSTIAAFSMVNRITDLVMQPMMGLSGALTSIVGQNVGGRQVKRARAFFFQALRWTIAFSAIGMIVMKIFDLQLLGVFISESDAQDVYTKALEYLYYSIAFTPLMGIFSCFTGFFQGIRYTKYPMYLSLSRLWLVRLPFIVLFKNLTDFGSTGVWISMMISNAYVCVFAYALYRFGKWRLDPKFLIKEEASV